MPPQATLAQQANAIRRRVRLGQTLAATLPTTCAYRLQQQLTPIAGHNTAQNAPLQHDLFSHWCRQTHPSAPPHQDPHNTQRAWQAARGSYAAFFINLALHHHRPHTIAQRTHSHSPDWAHLTQETNGHLLLTLHHDTQHTLCTQIGLSGRAPLRVIAAPEASSPLHPWLGPTIHRMHRHCAAHFRGGDYLFVHPEDRTTGLALAHALRRGECLVSLNDFSVSHNVRHQPAHIFNRAYLAPTGSIEIACRLRKPIYFAAMVWQPQHHGYHLECHRLPNTTPHHALQAYTRAIETTARQWPWAWSGWQWHHTWPTSAP